jgi:hypothetical protein
VAALDDPEAEIRLQALRSLARLADSRVVPRLERIVDRPRATDPATLGLALLTLARLGGAKEADRIVGVLATAEGPTRRAAAEALVALDPGGEQAPAAVSEALAKLATTEGLGDQTRQAAIRRLAAPEMLKAMVLDPQTTPPFRAAALERLAGVADAVTLGGVLAQIPKDAGSRLLNPAARLAATRLSTASATRLLGGWLEAPSEDARRAAAQAIGAARKPEFFALARARPGCSPSRSSPTRTEERIATRRWRTSSGRGPTSTPAWSGAWSDTSGRGPGTNGSRRRWAALARRRACPPPSRRSTGPRTGRAANPSGARPCSGRRRASRASSATASEARAARTARAWRRPTNA